MKIYNSVNYDEMRVGEKVKDDFFGSIWKVIKNVPNGAVIKNIKGRDKGVTMTITPDVTTMMFQTIE